MQILKTIHTNWRDLLVGLVLTFGLSFGSDALERVSVTSDGHVWLSNVVDSMRKLSSFAGANLSAFFMFAVAWPTVNTFNNNRFKAGWDSLTEAHKFLVLVAVSISYLIAAAICFSA